AHCASCPASAATCALCERGWLLDVPSCVTGCPGSSVALGGLCTACHGSCATCYGPEPEHCLTCGPAAPLHLDGACLGACPAGTYQAGPACLPCSVSCAACSGPDGSECVSCPGDRLLLEGHCLSSCPEGYFPQGNVCRPCAPSCRTCRAPDTCASCPAGALLTPAGACDTGCPAGWLACAPSGTCVPCPEGCAECRPGQAPCSAECTACAAGWVLSDGACHGACPPGQYHPQGADRCAWCEPGCRTCFGQADSCTSCPAGLVRTSAGTCAGSCPAGSAPVDAACLRCPAGCEQCTAGEGQAGCTLEADGSLACPVMGSCDGCAGGLFLVDGSACVAACPPGTFGQEGPLSPVCAPCHVKCRACTGPGAEDCSRVPGSRSSHVGLAVGLSLGLLFLLILLLLLVLFLVRRHAGMAATGKDPADAEDATMLNTIVELALPGAILVGVDTDFRPLDEQLGAGTQASVYAAQAIGAGIAARLGCPDVVAVKKMRPEAMAPVHHAMFQNEVALMWLLREHGHIVRLFGYSEQPPAIVMERFDTDLDTLLHSEVPLSSLQLADICQQWASGLEAMHAHGIAHCDLKPGNVFASQRPDGGWRAALGDLGTSRNLNTDRSSVLVNTMPELNAMTVRYAAPEVIAAFLQGAPLDRRHFFPADVYSAAVMLLECITRTGPWPGLALDQIVAAVQADGRPDTAPLPADGPLASVRDLVQVAWHSQADRRPAAAIFRQRCVALLLATGGDPGHTPAGTC
ncbi:TKL protein kinase, partial [Fonticula alba]